MDLSHISNLLNRFRKLTPSDTYIKEAFIAIVEEQFKETIHKNNIRVEGGVLYIIVHPNLKSELHMRKDTILRSLNERLGGKGSVRSIV